LLAWGSIVELELTFFEEQRERCLMNAIVLSQYSLGLTPKIFDAVDVVFSLGKVGRMVDSVMMKSTHVKRVAGATGIGVDHAVRLDFAGNNGYQGPGSWCR